MGKNSTGKHGRLSEGGREGGKKICGGVLIRRTSKLEIERGREETGRERDRTKEREREHPLYLANSA